MLRIVSLDLKKGIAELSIECEDDLWALYSIIEKGDVVAAKTTREVKFGEGGESRRIPMVVSIRVESVEFQPFTDKLRIKGVVVDTPEEYGIKGKHHTIAVSPGMKIVLWKNNWREYHVERLREFSKVRERVVVVVLDYDEACIAVIGEQGVRVVAELRSGMPGKYYAVDASSIVNKYVSDVAERAVNVAEQYSARVVVVASPGDLAERVASMLENRVERVFRDSVSIGGCSGLGEVLRRGVIKRAVAELSVLKAQDILEEFRELLAKNHELVAYGLDDVEYAVQMNAVKKMVVSSDRIHSLDDDMRARFSNLIEAAYERGAEVVIVPYDSDAGREVSDLGGVIAVLRYPLQRPVS